MGRSHCQSPPALCNKLFVGDAKEVMDTFPNESVHLVFTSPPYYNAKQYSQFDSYGLYLDSVRDVAVRVHRVLKEGRFFVLNTSPVIVPRERRSSSSTRYAITHDLHPLLTEVGFDFIEDIVWVKPEGSAKNRGGGFFQTRKPLMYKTNPHTESLMVYRKRTPRLIDWNLRQYSAEVISKSLVQGDYPRGNVWEISPSNSKKHPAVFPVELAKNVVSLYSMWGDLVLDPFVGSGTTCVAAKLLERKYVGIDQHEEYIDVARERIFRA